MVRHAIVNRTGLDSGWVLAPERYDPRRQLEHSGSNLSDVVDIVREHIGVGKTESRTTYLVLDTSDAREGVVLTRKEPVGVHQLGSTKKLLQAGDVIVSRLRPYLRQVAYVDSGLVEGFGLPDVQVCCSTEFFVLRSRNARSIACLVPYLLSDSVQIVLGASQEGGHHPRFSQTALESIQCPDWLLTKRDEMSRAVESLVSDVRRAEIEMRKLIDILSLSNHMESTSQMDANRLSDP